MEGSSACQVHGFAVSIVGMKTLLLIILTLLSSQSFAQSITGRWKTIDDETGKPKSIIEIYQEGNEFKGRILEVLNPDTPDPKCDKCEGAKKDQPIKGMEIIWGLS